MKSYLYYEEQITVRRPSGGSTPPIKVDDNPLAGCFGLVVIFIVICFALKGCAS